MSEGDYKEVACVKGHVFKAHTREFRAVAADGPVVCPDCLLAFCERNGIGWLDLVMPGEEQEVPLVGCCRVNQQRPGRHGKECPTVAEGVNAR